MPHGSKASSSASTSPTPGPGDQAIKQSSDPQRLIVMGTGPFAVPSFEALRLAGHQIDLVVTRPQPPVKSRKGPPASPVRSWAQSSALEIFDPESINDEDAIERIGNVNAALLVVCDYGQILKPAALETAHLGGINLHGSLLPRYRGAAPVQWAMLSGDEETGVSVIHMTPRLDGGPIITTRKTTIRDDETAGELEQRLAILGVDATLEAVQTVSEWDGETPIGQPQDPELVTKAPRLKKSDGDIDWGRSAREIDCHVRGMQPWPVAFTHYRTDHNSSPLRLAIKKIQIHDSSSIEFCSGEILIDPLFLVATGDRLIEIQRLQPAGKREMDGKDFLRGHPPKPGSRLFSP